MLKRFLLVSLVLPWSAPCSFGHTESSEMLVNHAGAPGRELVAVSAPEISGQHAEGSTAIVVNADLVEPDVMANADRVESTKDEVLTLETLKVKGRQETFDNSIDRKVYNVGKDLHSSAGSTSDLLQNVPSVQIDVEGNVSLRGASDVTILINGKASASMGRGRADTLAQMPADSIERIEVITNPSAKFRPDGTGGIINIVLKKDREPGYSGSVRVNVGSNERSSLNVSGNYQPGRVNVYGRFGIRQEHRERFSTDVRSFQDSRGDTVATRQEGLATTRPLSRSGQVGVEYTAPTGTTLGASVNYSYRDHVQRSDRRYVATTNDVVTQDYVRSTHDPEFSEDLEFTARLTRNFGEQRELSIELKRSVATDEEDHTYTNRYTVPVGRPTTREHSLILVEEAETEFTADYEHPFNRDAKLELGYAGRFETNEFDFQFSDFDFGSGGWTPDLVRSNEFIYDSTIHALYSTFAAHRGPAGVLAGLRYEHQQVDTDQVTADLQNRNSFGRVYPTVHLSYNLADGQSLQLNYSQRVRRPGADDYNPYPEYQDPFNIWAGNPNLRPEQVHSIETGWQLKQGEQTYLATAYYRYRQNGITDVTRMIDDQVMLTTRDNMAVSRASGLEFGATHRWFDQVKAGLSGNVYRNEIDAGNLGFDEIRSAISWDAKLSVAWDMSKATMLQLNANYTAKRLTPQGHRAPSTGVNLGFRHNFTARKMALIVTVSDVFDSQRWRTVIDTPTLQSDTVRRRAGRIVYAGLTYSFGKQNKRTRDELTYDDGA